MTKFQPGHVKAFYDPKTKQAVASTDSVDRMGEIIDQDGWDLKNFLNNPVLLWAHDDRTPRIGLAQNIRIDKSMGSPRLMFEPKFNEATELSRAIKQIYESEGGTFSVGFMPLERDGDTYTKSELLEISAVNVPANPDAMTMAYRGLVTKGFSQETAMEVTGIKGPIMDELNDPDDWQVKMDNMSDIFNIFNAFCDCYYDDDTDPTDFQSLLKECVSLFGKVLNGSYSTQTPVTASFKKVLDKTIDGIEDSSKSAKIPSIAPKRKHHEERLAMAKIITRAADILNRNEKLPDVERKSVTNVIKRASEIVIEQHKGELRNG